MHKEHDAPRHGRRGGAGDPRRLREPRPATAPPATRPAPRRSAPTTAPTGSPATPADGTRGNPSGTAAERAFDRTVGTNTSGAYPAQRDGTRANPPAPARRRAYDRATGLQRPPAPTRASAAPGRQRPRPAWFTPPGCGPRPR